MPNAKRTKLRRAIAGSARLATLLADELLTGICEEPAKAQVSADVLYAAHAHRKEARPLPGRPGLKVADALKKWRTGPHPLSGGAAHHPFRLLAIDKAEVRKEKPVHIHVRMTNSAGIFQLDFLFREKLLTPGLRDYIELSAEAAGEEKRVIERYALGKGVDKSVLLSSHPSRERRTEGPSANPSSLVKFSASLVKSRKEGGCPYS